MRLRFVASDPHGGGHLRSFWPAEALRALGHTTEAYQWWPRAAEYDVVIVHRPLGRDNLARIRRYQRAGLQVFVDEDDDLTCVPETNPGWRPELAGPHDAAVAAADGVIVTTERLLQVYGAMNPNTRVVRNYLPGWVSAMAVMPRRARPRIGWTGTLASHLHDLEWFAPMAATACQGASLVLVGDRKALQVLQANAPWEHWGYQDEMPSLYRLMARADIGIVPLDPRPFNVAKSWLKALEFMSVGVPVVVTNLPEQAALVTHGVDGYLADDPVEFASYVQVLVNDPERRAIMGAAAREKARGLALEHHVAEWDYVLRQRKEQGRPRP